MQFSQLFDRSFSGAWWKQVLWLSGAILVVFVISWLISIFVMPNGTQGWDVVQLLIDPGAFTTGGTVDSSSVVQYSAAQQWFSFIVTVFGAILFSGMLISLISNILQRRVERYNKGQVFYNYSNHILVLGYNRITPAVISHICEENDDAIIVIASEQDSETVKNALSVALDEKYFKRLFFNHAKRNSSEFLDKLKVAEALGVYVLGESEETEHDIRNIETLNLIATECANSNRIKKLPVTVQLDNHSSYALFQSTDIDGKVKAHINFTQYNFNEYWARRILVPEILKGKDDCEYEPLDYKPLTADSDQYVHLVIFGMTGMGQFVAAEAAHVAHYSNFVTKGLKTKITLIDREASKEMVYFQGRYKELFKLCRWHYRKFESGHEVPSESFTFTPENDYLDIEWEFINAFSSDTALENELISWCNDKNQVLTFVVCDKNPAKNTATAFFFPHEVYDKKVPVLVQQPTSNSIADTLKESSKFSMIKPFGMYSHSFSDMNDILETMGKGINYVYFVGDYNKLPSTMPKEESDSLWDKCTVAIKWSNIYSAITYWTKSRYFTGIDDDKSPEMRIAAEVEHIRWCVEKLMIGFRPVTEDEYDAIQKDIALKDKYKKLFAHYDLRPYDELCPDESGVNVSENDILMIQTIDWIMQKQTL